MEVGVHTGIECASVTTHWMRMAGVHGRRPTVALTFNEHCPMST